MSSNYQVFARKYRPRTFNDVLGQDHVVQTLRNAIEKDRLAHAYLFVGPRGTGKTSTARILAKALNCPNGPSAEFDPDDPVCSEIAEGISLDVLEIDGASNNGVEQVRELRDTVKFAPSSGQFKIYYIDEVHMLTSAAFNALLKTLEEPPPHVKFIFATTEPQKILPTIISRCQRFDLRRIPTDIIAKHLRFIAQEEGITMNEPAAFAIAKGAEGGMRDAQSMLDQLVAFCGNEIDENNVLEIFGFNSAESISELAEGILLRDNAKSLEQLHQHAESGKDLSKLLADLISHYRNVLLLQADPQANSGELSAELFKAVQRQAGLVDTQRLLNLIDLFAETDARMKWAPNKKLHFEIGIIKAVQSLGEASLDDVISLISGAELAAQELPAVPAAAPSQPKVEAAPEQEEAPAAVEEVSKVEEAPAKQATESEISSELASILGDPSGGNAEQAVDAPAETEQSPAPSEPDEPVAPEASDEPPTQGSLSGLELWNAAQEALIAARPLYETWLYAAHFLSHEAGAIRLGFASDQRFIRESLSRYESEMAEKISALAGMETHLAIEVSNELAAIEMPVEAEEAPPEPEPVQATEPEPPAPAQPEPEEEAIEDDPLIAEALRVFEARVIKS